MDDKEILRRLIAEGRIMEEEVERLQNDLPSRIMLNAIDSIHSIFCKSMHTSGQDDYCSYVNEDSLMLAERVKKPTFTKWRENTEEFIRVFNTTPDGLLKMISNVTTTLHEGNLTMSERNLLALMLKGDLHRFNNAAFNF